MIEAVLDDTVDTQAAHNNSPFDPAVDYAGEIQKRDAATDKWKSLPEEESAKYRGDIQRYLAAEGVSDFKTPIMNAAKNLYIVRREIAAQIVEEMRCTLWMGPVRMGVRSAGRPGRLPDAPKAVHGRADHWDVA